MSRLESAAVLLLALLVPCAPLDGQGPPVLTPYNGDPRLEPIPSTPVTLSNFTVLAAGGTLSMRFPPRVNGQTQSDGDRHSDLFVLFFETTGAPVPQRVIVEGAPKGAAPGIDDLTARRFSAVRQVHAVLVDAAYNPGNPLERIDSAAEIHTSPWVRRVYQTNIFLNAPALPNGSNPGPGVVPALEAFFEGQVVALWPAEVSDGALFPQVLFKIEDANGNVVGPPWLIATRRPGEPFFSPVWDVWTIRLPSGTNAAAIRSVRDAEAAGALIQPSGIRVNAPVTAINGVPVPPENWFALLTGANGRFDPGKFPFDVPRGTFTPARTFRVTKSEGPTPLPAPGAGAFPAVDPDGRGNVVPVLLQDPFQLLSSCPGTSGPKLRVEQAELDAAFLNNAPPQLPAAVEANLSALVGAGLLSAEWLPGGRPYQERLALVGRALFEFEWQTPQGASQKDVTTCMACHSLPAAGGGARGLYTLQRGGTATRSSAGSMWGSGAAELLIQQKLAAGETGITFAHGSLGLTPTVRGVVNGASNTHFGIQSAEFVGGQTGNPLGFDAVTDLDGDGVANEQSVGEVTAETAYLLTLPVPDQGAPGVLESLGIDPQSVSEGRTIFRRPIDAGGAGCAACHRPFHVLDGDVYLLRNPQTTTALPLQVPHHEADADDVAEGLAAFVGQMGLRTWGDYRRHKMGSRMAVNGNDVLKTAELWDAGSVAPYGAGGAFDGSLLAATAAHEGVPLAGLVEIGRSQQFNFTSGSTRFSLQFVSLRNDSGATIPASAAAPVRVTLTGTIAPGILAVNVASLGPGGSRRHGASWTITQPIPPASTVTLALVFENPGEVTLGYSLSASDHAGYSESVASARAFLALPAAEQQKVVDFLRAQLIADSPGEGRP